MKSTSVCLASFLFSSAVLASGIETSFDSIRPSQELVWSPCFQSYTCAKLEVPLDYSNPEIGTTEVAFIKQASDNPDAQDILFNPGGPGGSGIDFILGQGDFYKNTAFGRHYNLIGFDPRGVNNSGINLGACSDTVVDQPTTPTAVSFHTRRTRKHRDVSSKVWGQSDLQDSQSEFKQLWTEFSEWSKNCTATQTRDKQISRYANTIAVAKDMLQYIEARAESLGQPPEEANLWYYGASYGTVLGATFAAMYPDRVGRMILDGVVDSDDYYSGQQSTTLIDTDKAAKSFFETCFKAKSKCAMYQNDLSANAIQQRFNRLLVKLKTKPIMVSGRVTGQRQPSIIYADDVKNTFFMGLYSPIDNFPKLARVFQDLEDGNGKSYAVLATQLNQDDDSGSLNTQISCNDAAGRLNFTSLDQFSKYINSLNNQSFYGADISFGGAPCLDYGIVPPRSQIFTGQVSAKRTSSPILFVSTTADPVTPLVSARKMSSQFGNSAVLAVDGAGHTSTAAKSRCTWRHMQRYLTENKTPPLNTICPSEEVPFVTNTDDEKVAKEGAGNRTTVKWSVMVVQMLILVLWSNIII